MQKDIMMDMEKLSMDVKLLKRLRAEAKGHYRIVPDSYYNKYIIQVQSRYDGTWSDLRYTDTIARKPEDLVPALNELRKDYFEILAAEALHNRRFKKCSKF